LTIAKKMKKLLILFLLWSCSLAPTFGENETATPEELTRMYYTSGSMLDYESLVEHMHPYTLSRFKELSLEIIKSFAEKESPEVVFEAFEGISSTEELGELTDEIFWVYVMGTISSHVEEKEWNKKVVYISSVEEGDYLYALHRLSHDLETTRAKEELSAPRVITFKRDGNKWKYYSFHVGSVERYFKWHIQTAHSQQTGAIKAE